MKTFIKKNGRAQREIVCKPFYEGKGRHKDFYKGKWPRAARKFFVRLFVKGNAVIKTFIKGTTSL